MMGDERTRYRTGDWDTSVEAGRLADEHGQCRADVEAIHSAYPDGLTDGDLRRLVWERQEARGHARLWPDNSVRKRRTDLTYAGVLVATDERRMGPNGRAMVVWRYVSNPAERVPLPPPARAHDDAPRCDYGCVWCEVYQ